MRLTIATLLFPSALFAQADALPTRSVSASDPIGAKGIRSFSKVNQGTPTNRSSFEQRASLVDLDLDVERSADISAMGPASAADWIGSFLSGESRS